MPNGTHFMFSLSVLPLFMRVDKRKPLSKFGIRINSVFPFTLIYDRKKPFKIIIFTKILDFFYTFVFLKVTVNSNISFVTFFLFVPRFG